METPSVPDATDYAGLLESLPVATAVADVTGVVLFANTQFCRLFGYADGEAAGVAIGSLVEGAAGLDCSPGADPIPLPGRHRDGSQLLVETGCRTWATRLGPLLLYTAADLTPRIAAERGRRQAERRLADIINNTTAVVYAKDLGGRYQMINRQYEALFGVTREEVVGKTDYDLFPADMAEAFRRNDRAVMASGRVLEVEEVAPHADGPHTYISVKFPLRDHDDRVCGMAGISTDISDRLARLRVEQELRAAQAIQQLLYPAAPPRVPGFDVAGAVYPAHVMCGDYFDYLVLPDDRLVCVVADVTGHGIGPALEMVETRAMFRAMIHTESDLQLVLSRLNRFLVTDLPPDNFVSLFLADIDVTARTVRYCAAGHEGLLVRRGGEVVRLDSTDLLLGVLPDGPFELTPPLALGSGDVLLLVTDGVTETFSLGGGFFGWDGPVEVVRRSADRPAREIVDAVYRATRAFSGTAEQTDDVTVLVVKTL